MPISSVTVSYHRSVRLVRQPIKFGHNNITFAHNNHLKIEQKQRNWSVKTSFNDLRFVYEIKYVVEITSEKQYFQKIK